MTARTPHPAKQISPLSWLYVGGLVVTAGQIVSTNWDKCTGTSGCEISTVVETVLYSLSWPIYWAVNLV